MSWRKLKSGLSRCFSMMRASKALPFRALNSAILSIVSMSSAERAIVGENTKHPSDTSTVLYNSWVSHLPDGTNVVCAVASSDPR